VRVPAGLADRGNHRVERLPVAASYRGVAVASGVRERCTVVAMPPTAAVAPR